MRFALREATHDAHVALEDEIGDLADRQAYVRYVRGLAAFRASLEPALERPASALPGFRMTVLAPLLAQDLNDLGETPVALPAPPDMAAPADVLGALYVLEGSALGARVLIKKVEALGFGPTHGARHLSHQASSLDAWRRLVQILDAGDWSTPRAIASANAAFRLAHGCMKRARHA